MYNLPSTSLDLQVLLPCSLLISMQGPLDKPAIDINAIMGPVRLTLSPPVVRLIAHAVKTLTPQKVKIVVMTVHPEIKRIYVLSYM